MNKHRNKSLSFFICFFFLSVCLSLSLSLSFFPFFFSLSLSLLFWLRSSWKHTSRIVMSGFGPLGMTQES